MTKKLYPSDLFWDATESYTYYPKIIKENYSKIFRQNFKKYIFRKSLKGLGPFFPLKK